MTTRTDQARSLIGEGAGDDHVIAPSTHAERYAAEAPGLARILRLSEVEVVARSYEERDAAAVEAQGEFRRATRGARGAFVVTGLGAALLLALGSLSGVLPRSTERVLFIGFSLVATVAGAVAAFWIRRIREGRLLERWMSRRAEAETNRLRYFELVAKEHRAEDPLVQLEYFRRYQLDVQRRFYGVRRREHEVAADRAQTRGSAAMAAAAVLSGAAGLLAATLGPGWAAVAGLALAAQAVGGALENSEATAQNRRNAERFERTRVALDALYARLDRVRDAVAGGRVEALDRYVDAVHEQLSLEHRQWLEEQRTADSAVGRLEELLDGYRPTE